MRRLRGWMRDGRTANAHDHRAGLPGRHVPTRRPPGVDPVHARYAARRDAVWRRVVGLLRRGVSDAHHERRLRRVREGVPGRAHLRRDRNRRLWVPRLHVQCAVPRLPRRIGHLLQRRGTAGVVPVSMQSRLWNELRLRQRGLRARHVLPHDLGDELLRAVPMTVVAPGGTDVRRTARTPVRSGRGFSDRA
jgi:hypothetical protein